jgi:hypothetical protein
MKDVENMDRMAETLAIPPDFLDLWETFLACEGIPYDLEGWKENSSVWTKTVKFRDGIEADVEVVSRKKSDGDCFARTTLYSVEDNRFVKIGESEARNSLRGEWKIPVSFPDGTERVYSISVENWKNPESNG